MNEKKHTQDVQGQFCYSVFFCHFRPPKNFFIKMCHMRENPVEPHRYLSFLTIIQMAETFAHVLRINANLSICE